MTKSEFTLESGAYPICVAVLEGDTITITRMSRDRKERIAYRLPTQDLRYIVVNKRSKPHSPLAVYRTDTTVLYQPLPNTITVTTKGNQFPFEFGYFYLNDIIKAI